LSRKLRLIKRLERHLRKHPNDKQAKELLEALKEGRYEWRGKSVVIKPKEAAAQSG
jgi:vacuolar-type H+-ATPase subunit E/Vma4